MGTAGQKTNFWLQAGGGGESEEKWFTQIVLISKTLKINFMSLDIDLGSMSPFPPLKLHINCLSLGK